MIPARNIGKPQGAMELLNCRRLPGRLNTTEAAILLGFQEHDIPLLVTAKLLTPLGKPAQNAPKYFAGVEIAAFAQDREWLNLATKALARFWINKNQRRGTIQLSPEPRP